MSVILYIVAIGGHNIHTTPSCDRPPLSVIGACMPCQSKCDTMNEGVSNCVCSKGRGSCMVLSCFICHTNYRYKLRRMCMLTDSETPQPKCYTIQQCCHSIPLKVPTSPAECMYRQVHATSLPVNILHITCLSSCIQWLQEATPSTSLPPVTEHHCQ